MTQEYVPPTGGQQYQQYPPQYWYPPRPPQKSAATTVILTLLLGVFGAIAALGQSNNAKALGYKADRYWIAFGICMIFNLMWVIMTLVAVTQAQTTYYGY